MSNKTPVTFDSYKDFKGYVINLNRETWRYEEVYRKLTSVGFTNIERVSAVDYKETDVNAEIRLMGAQRLERFVSDAEIAVTLSHFRAMQLFLSSGDPYCFIFEDDVTPIAKFRDHADFNDIYYGDFDLLCFGGAYAGRDYDSWGTEDLSQIKEAQKNNCSHINDCCFWQGHAYLISRNAAYRLLQGYPAWASSEDYKKPHIDVYLSSYRRIKNKFIVNQNIDDVGQYMQGDRFAARMCGVLFQEGDYISTISPHQHSIARKVEAPTEKDITVIVCGSYLDSHPDITFMREVLDSLQLTGLSKDVHIILSHDRIKPGTAGIEEKEMAYNQYFENLKSYISSSDFNNVEIVQSPSWGHLTRSLKNAVSMVKTKYMLVLQHDIHIRREVPVLNLMGLMQKHKNIKHLRFNVRRNYPIFMWWDGYTGGTRIFAEEEYDGVKVCVTPAWSDQNHLTTKEYYEQVVFPDCTNSDGELIWDFMENRMNGLCHHNHAKYGTYIYGEYGATRTSRHSDGRKSSPEPDED